MRYIFSTRFTGENNPVLVIFALNTNGSWNHLTRLVVNLDDKRKWRFFFSNTANCHVVSLIVGGLDWAFLHVGISILPENMVIFCFGDSVPTDCLNDFHLTEVHNKMKVSPFRATMRPARM